MTRPRTPTRRNSAPRTLPTAQATGFILRWLRRSVWAQLVLVLVLGSWYAYESLHARPKMAFAGVPVHRDALTQFSLRILRNDAFMVGYSDWLGNPLWVSYQVLPAPEKTTHLPRPDRFDSDWRSLRCLVQVACISHDDYTGSGYDRGHLAPNHVIATRFGAEAQKQTFLMTNISPQRPDLNRRTWQRLESLAANEFSRAHGPYWVVTGPIFGKNPAYLSSTSARIAIPEAFYQVLIDTSETPGQPPKTLAFIVPQTVKGQEDLRSFVVTVREVENRTGLNFFQNLDDDTENRIETTVDKTAWGLTQDLATQRSRY